MLFETLKTYCKSNNLQLGSIVPQTWIINGDKLEQDVKALISDKILEDPEFKHPLIIKPGEGSNRGQGIVMAFTVPDTTKLIAELLENRKNTQSVVV